MQLLTGTYQSQQLSRDQLQLSDNGGRLIGRFKFRKRKLDGLRFWYSGNLKEVPENELFFHLFILNFQN